MFHFERQGKTMKNTMIWFGCLFLLIAMSIGTVLAQEGEVTEVASNDAGPGLMIGVFVLGAVVIAGLGLAMSSQQAAENNSA
jgi:predicted transporter